MPSVGSSILTSPSTTANTVSLEFNITLGPVSTEQSQALPSNTKHFTLKTRNKSSLQIAYTLAGSGTTWITVPGGTEWEDNAFYTSQTIYFQSADAGSPGDVVEIFAQV